MAFEPLGDLRRTIEELSGLDLSACLILEFSNEVVLALVEGQVKDHIKEMEREATRYRYRVRGTGGGGGGGAVEPSPTNDTNSKGASASPELLLQWGNRKRLRCVKFQRRDDDAAPGLHSTTAAAAARVDRALRGATSTAYKRVLRNNSEATGVATRAKRGVSLPERERGGRGSACTEGTHENEGGGGGGGGGGRRGGSPSSGSEGAATIWPKFALALTNKEKEEDFFAFKGSKLPPRPKKRAKLLQRTINLVSPGAWLCDLTLDRYEVREKKISKKRPRGLKAMGNMESDSE
ncbi:hypothetical protein OPV22_019207 [Ensete ventricosum]|uniref:Uncharacterized protein n=1 Tax=Ensete ventricosum TaxID=4639 RepID=A0AAV8QVY1_ENSVE|nr:hypothetical protein OPV22_019207 [Ensete ventricosum]